MSVAREFTTVGTAPTRRRQARRVGGLARRLTALAALALVAAGPALAESRVALVIGNGGYKAVPELANPPNDAKDVAEALKSWASR